MNEEKKYTPCHIDCMAGKCGWFNAETNANNGYGCDHPSQEEREKTERTDFVDQGKCYAFSCPIAHRMDDEEWAKFPESSEGYGDDEEYVVQHSPCKDEEV